MLYRCLACGREEARGCLPTVACGLYLMALLGLAAGLPGAALALAKWALAPLRPPEPAPDPPWWLWPVALAVWVGLLVGTVAGLNWLLPVVERLVVGRWPCPACGSRRWSRGFTRGFGLQPSAAEPLYGHIRMNKDDASGRVSGDDGAS